MRYERCDRCGGECKTPYWIIEMWETGRENHTKEGIYNNMITNLKRHGKRQDRYCFECVKSIKKYIKDI